MADPRGSNSKKRKATLRRRRRAAELTGAIGAFATLGLLAAAPEASADEFDVIIDEVLSAITGALGDQAAVSGALPDVDGVGAADTTGLASLFDVGSGAVTNPADDWVHELEQGWINSALGQQVDTVINSWFNQLDPLTGACGLICNGADGVGGGLIFGDAAASALAAPAMSQNLLVNPSFELADPSESGYSGVTIPGWTETGNPTVIPYGAPVNYPLGLSFPLPGATGLFGFPAAPAGDGANFAGGGPVATSSISQVVDVTGAAGTPYQLSADLGGQTWNPSYTDVQITFHDANGDVVGSTASLEPVTVWDRLGFSGFEHRDITGTIPEGATSATITDTFVDKNLYLGNYNGAYADNESFTVGDLSLTAASLTTPTSDVGHLDHVFLIYMENKGAEDIVGSPNAPFLNHLINTEGYADNFFALSHPSDPNYIRVMGGSDFGIDYNPTSAVVDAPSLMQEMDQAGITWAGYQQDIAPGTTVTPQDVGTPFGQFNYVVDNTSAYLQQHLFSLADLATNLQNPSTFPAFTWISADEDHNMEGPVDTLSGVLQFIATQFTDHQYNVAVGDQFVQQEVAAIENSATWNDPTQRDAIIITFDEDNNNLSLGFGNDGNHVPMIVIPNQDAVTAGGMQSGHFTTDDYYNQYSLMATIEDALRSAPGTLAPLTANDMYAPPMNAFWK